MTPLRINLKTISVNLGPGLTPNYNPANEYKLSLGGLLVESGGPTVGTRGHFYTFQKCGDGGYNKFEKSHLEIFK